MFEPYRTEFKKMASEVYDLFLSDEQIDSFFSFGTALLSWNEKINLTTITRPREIIIKHFLDSLIFARYLIDNEETGYIELADIGTGAGFPGIPLKIMIPKMQINLIDSLLKRVNYLHHIINDLELKRITALQARAEDIGRNNIYRGRFDIVTSRAVADLPILLEYTVPLLKVGGKLLAAKGREPEEEIERSTNALNTLHCQVDNVQTYHLSNEAEYRSFLVITKKEPTPPQYPRKAGKPKKDPL